MNLTATVDCSAQLIAEVERYLEAVELFRALRCEPVWRGEQVANRRTEPC
jgi:hypothetical protein